MNFILFFKLFFQEILYNPFNKFYASTRNPFNKFSNCIMANTALALVAIILFRILSTIESLVIFAFTFLS